MPDIRYRLEDVAILRTKACQDFLRMVLKPGWQNNLFEKAESSKYDRNHDARYWPLYQSAYNRMRDYGVENYSVDDMDMTIMTQIVLYNPKMVSLQKETKDLFKNLRENRNDKSHLAENEQVEELFLEGILSLYNLKKFVRAVDDNELFIEIEERSAYRKKYIKEIDELKSSLDEERINVIQIGIEVDKDIQRIINDKNPKDRFEELRSLYIHYYLSVCHDLNRVKLFFIRAKDAGIVYAFDLALTFMYWDKEDFSEADKQLNKWLDSLCIGEIGLLVGTINHHMKKHGQITDGMQAAINHLIDKGHLIKKVKKDSQSYYTYTVRLKDGTKRIIR